MITGLGDAVAKVAKPIAKTIDRATSRTRFETNISSCKGCGRRQKWLNKVAPFKREIVD